MVQGTNIVNSNFEEISKMIMDNRKTVDLLDNELRLLYSSLYTSSKHQDFVGRYFKLTISDGCTIMYIHVREVLSDYEMALCDVLRTDFEVDDKQSLYSMRVDKGLPIPMFSLIGFNETNFLEIDKKTFVDTIEQATYSVQSIFS